MSESSKHAKEVARELIEQTHRLEYTFAINVASRYIQDAIDAATAQLRQQLAARDAEIATLRQELETLQTDNEVNATGHRLRLIAWKPTKP
jgi:polyhydroxyalkanoate synthesis regulator phasin